MSLFIKKILKAYFLHRTVLKTLAFSNKINVEGMINLLYNQCRRQETFKMFNSIPGIVTYSNGNAFYEIQLRNMI